MGATVGSEVRDPVGGVGDSVAFPIFLVGSAVVSFQGEGAPVEVEVDGTDDISESTIGCWEGKESAVASDVGPRGALGRWF